MQQRSASEEPAQATQPPGAAAAKASPSSQRAVVVLCRPAGPVNVGLTCRAAANMGASAVRVVKPLPLALDGERGRPFACKAAEMWESIAVFDDLAAAVADCDFVLATTRRERHGRLSQWSPSEAREELAERPGRVAFVFGNEASGLSAEELVACDAAVALTLPGSYPSLNLSHAVSLALYTLLEQEPQRRAVAAPSQATSRERRSLTALIDQALTHTGFYHHAERARLQGKIARVIQSMKVASPDAQLLSGLFSHFASLPSAQAADPGAKAEP